MAASLIMKPGMFGGPCKRKCEHRDCAELRAVAGSTCRFCGGSVGYERRYYRNPDPTTPGEWVHAACLEDAEESRRRQLRGVVEF